jgi:16S rRNA (uracil1498-N3)-methyltransferase
LLKRENFEIAVQKATETGIKKIYPIITERTIKLNFKKNRLEKIIKEAAEQSGRGVIPVLNETLDFKKTAESAGRQNPNNLDRSRRRLDGKRNFARQGK